MDLFKVFHKTIFNLYDKKNENLILLDKNIVKKFSDISKTNKILCMTFK